MTMNHSPSQPLPQAMHAEYWQIRQDVAQVQSVLATLADLLVSVPVDEGGLGPRTTVGLGVMLDLLRTTCDSALQGLEGCANAMWMTWPEHLAPPAHSAHGAHGVPA
jgi:hypothetical protein